MTEGFTFGDKKAWKNGKREPFSELDLMYLSGLCHGYEMKRKQLLLLSKLKGLKEDVVASSK